MHPLTALGDPRRGARDRLLRRAQSDGEIFVFYEVDAEREEGRRGGKKKLNLDFFPSKNISTSKAAIVTCGGLCPGLNDVVQSLTQKLAGGYGVKNIVGVRYGLKGFYDKMRKSIKLTSAAVEGIQLQGGTILGTSRGGADIAKIVQSISRQAIDMVFVVGGNGGNAAAAAIHEGKRKVGVFSPSSSSFKIKTQYFILSLPIRKHNNKQNASRRKSLAPSSACPSRSTTTSS